MLHRLFVSRFLLNCQFCLFCKQILLNNFMTFSWTSHRCFCSCQSGLLAGWGLQPALYAFLAISAPSTKGERIFQKSDGFCEYGYDAKCNINAATAEF